MSNTNPNDYVELLEVFRIALTNGLIDKKEVVKWADEIIQKDSEPNYFIIELSLSGHKSINDLVSLINEFIGVDKPKVSGRIILGFLYNQYLLKHITLKKVVSSINWIVWEINLKEEEKHFMYGLDEYYDLAVDGVYGTVEEVKKNTLDFLEIYKDFNIDNFSLWHEIDNTINEKVQRLLAINEEKKLAFIKAHQPKKKWWKIW